MAYSDERFVQSSSPASLLSQGSPDCAGDDALQFGHGPGRKLKGESFCYGFGAFFRRHEKTLPARATVWAREIIPA
jgi:hypothetical protein